MIAKLFLLFGIVQFAIADSTPLKFNNLYAGRNIRTDHDDKTADRLYKAKNVVINDVIFTGRALELDEVFKVQIDKVESEDPSNLVIGVSTVLSYDFEVEGPRNPNKSKTEYTTSSSWYLSPNKKLYVRGEEKEYGTDDSSTLKVGDTIGVVVKQNHDLHFFINGVDQGVAAHDVAVDNAVRGFIIMHKPASLVSIVE